MTVIMFAWNESCLMQ